MDVKETVDGIKSEYGTHLRQAQDKDQRIDSAVRADVSDAFFLYTNGIVPSFWEVFGDDASMKAAEEDLLDYLVNEKRAPQPEKRAAHYMNKLRGLRSFIDSKGGVKTIAAGEINCEKKLCDFARRVYAGELSEDEAVLKMAKDELCGSDTDHRRAVRLYADLIKNDDIARIVNPATALYFTDQIGKQLGTEAVTNALEALRRYIREHFEETGDTSYALRRGCARIAETYGVDLSFGPDILAGVFPKVLTDTMLAPDEDAPHYWIYRGGKGLVNWDRERDSGLMSIGWDGIPDPLGDLTEYGSREEIRETIVDAFRDDSAHHSQATVFWQFANVLKPGDVVFVKEGPNRIVGRGIVTGDYIYDDERGKPHVRSIEWTNKGRWDVPDMLAMRTLTDITTQTGLVRKIQALIAGDDPENDALDAEAAIPSPDPYGKVEFLGDVYMEADEYERIMDTLRRKKNIILQGAPGTGKTRTAKRLAYSAMGEKDRSRVQMVQFHPGYSYADFIADDGSNDKAPAEGVFYRFCRIAAEDDRPYFFIIDEINRGDVRKIFGDVFMLVEADKRGVEVPLKNGEEQFSVPNNVYIIGTMNTADNTLEVPDFGLRRRFAFCEMAPAFDSEGFKAYQKAIDNPKFDRLISVVKELNEVIANDPELGDNFLIGHGDFCQQQTIGDEWMKSVVDYQLIPLLKEYWTGEPGKIREWTAKLKEAVA